MKREKVFGWLSWFFVLLTFFSAWMISQVDDYSLWFLLLLSGNIALAVVVAPKSDKVVLTVARVAVGLLFMYSGFVKGVDPLGTQWRIQDYFYAYNTLWALPFALYLSVLLNAFEFSLGVLLVLKLKIRLVSWLTLLLMIFFTVTTLNDALYNPVPDCGCFGDALIITNWQTFYKNLVIFAFVIMIFIRRKSYVNLRSGVTQYSMMAGVFLLFAAFEAYTIYHLPLIDFRPWKTGTRLLPENPEPAKYFFTYRNKKSGEQKEYLSSELPWQDSVFMADWEFVSQREEDPNAGFYRTFPMMDEDGNDLSKELVSQHNPVFFMVVYDIAKAGEENLKKFDDIYRMCNERGWDFYLLNSDVPEELKKYRKDYSLPDYPVLNSDDTALKAAVRSNPGLIIVRDAVVVAKFNHHDIPSVGKLVKIATN